MIEKNSEKNENSNLNQENQNDLYIKIKNKKVPKFFNEDELKEIKIIKKEREDYEENRLKRFIFNYNKYKLPPLSSISQKNLLDNNSILIRPNIISSAKQIQYEKDKTVLNDENFHLLIQRLVQQHHNEDLIIEKNKEDFNNYMEHLKILKVKEKFNIAQRNNSIKNDNLNIYNKKNINNIKEEEKEHKQKYNKDKKRSCLLILYEKIWNFCLKSPMDPYSSKKKIWAGKNGIFKRQFQDNRIFK